MKTVIITGAAGFIGSALCRYIRKENLARIVAIDAMTYAASPEALADFHDDPDFSLIQADVADAGAISKIFLSTQPDGVIHLAAETHVDRSIDNPGNFLRSNIVGTFSMLETTRVYLNSLTGEKRDNFRFLHVSTDEVYGALETTQEPAFTEETPYAPNSPYAASKASSDHLVRAWNKTFDLPALISNCSNNYGPYQFPEKLIPLCLTKALNGDKLPIYGKGENIRDWLFVEDHALALWKIFEEGHIGEKYNVGGDAEITNLKLVQKLCDLLDELVPDSKHKPHSDLITFVEDRPGHDARYAMNASKLKRELEWQPSVTLDEGLRQTVQWYLDNQEWCQSIFDRKYAGQRLGAGE